ncbi:MAG: YihY/virulence factor BrkB family protein [Anaerolineaceae bacterium]|nr:YihY/virulence factor BrkB family protein [Anaerolineaceae bacterium]
MNERSNNIWHLFVKPFQEWSEDNAPQLAAAIAYYTVFSITPVLVIALAVAGQFFNKDAVRSQLMAEISSFMGPETANFIGAILKNYAHTPVSLLASAINFVILLVGASGLFSQIQFALNKIWDVPPELQHRLMGTLKNRVISFLMVLVIGFLLLVFLVISAVASFINTRMNGSTQSAVLPQAINLILLFSIITILFAIVFRIVPDKAITWTDVWLGAGLTALLFMIGRYAIGLYLLFSRSGSNFGAAGSLIVLLIWIYYSAQIFLLEAEFTQVYARKFGSHKHLTENLTKAAEF